MGELEIVRVLAVGGFGIVYLAHDHALNRQVAVKEFMPAGLATRQQGRRVSVRNASEEKTFALGLVSFIDEAKLLARLSHPAIVKVHRFWKANGTGYMAMPYLRGPTLGDVRRSMSAPPTEAWLRRMTEPLLDALAALHAEGYYHRDIAPDNVLVSDNGSPVLLDFGAARRVIAGRPQAVTAIVKPHFAPIEQYAEARLLRQGPWSDLYALGALVAYLLDGVPPPASTARALHDEMQTLALRRVPGVSRSFLAAIDWALAVRPQHRPQSVAELRAALDGQRAPPRRPTPVATASAGHDMKTRASSFGTMFLNTLQLSRRDAAAGAEPRVETSYTDSNLEWNADAKASPGAGAATRSDATARPRPWAWATAAAVLAGAVIFGLAQAPLGAAPETLSANAVATVPTPSRAEALKYEAVIASRQAAGPSAAALPQAEARQPVEEIIDGPPERIVESMPAPAPAQVVAAAALSPTRQKPNGPNGPMSAAMAAPAAGNKAPKAEVRVAAANRPAHRHNANQRNAVALNVRGPGPVELCAERNFFLRTWCVQRRCEEPRFKGHLQCEPRQVANVMR